MRSFTSRSESSYSLVCPTNYFLKILPLKMRPILTLIPYALNSLSSLFTLKIFILWNLNRYRLTEKHKIFAIFVRALIRFNKRNFTKLLIAKSNGTLLHHTLLSLLFLVHIGVNRCGSWSSMVMKSISRSLVKYYLQRYLCDKILLMLRYRTLLVLSNSRKIAHSG